MSCRESSIMHLSQNGFYSKAYSVKIKSVKSLFRDRLMRRANYLTRTAHPNIKLFVYQGGIQSTEEAVYYAVPVLGIPIISEQESRIRRLVSLGAAMCIKLNKLTKERFDSAIRQIINNERYYIHCQKFTCHHKCLTCKFPSRFLGQLYRTGNLVYKHNFRG